MSRGAWGLTLALLAGSVQADSTVCPAGPPDCDFSTIQEALDAAESGDVITVTEPGTYEESNLRRARQNITIKSKDPGARASYIISGVGGTVVHMGLGWTLQGFTITGGSASDGGGITLGGGNATIRDCVIRNNSASGGGGGVYTNTGGASMVIENTLLHDNQARFGGAVSTSTSLTLRNSLVFDNTAARSGAQAAFGGGLSVSGDLVIENSLIFNNTVTGSGGIGGGVIKRSGGNLVEISGSVFNGNSVTSGTAGGLALGGGTATVAGSVFQGNSASMRGGGVELTSGPATFVGTIIVGNNAPDGGGLYCSGGSLEGYSGVLDGNADNQIGGACAGCSQGQTRSCSTGEPGVCDAGTQSCNADNTWGVCQRNDFSAIINFVEAEEGDVCSDTLDNDCDSLVDQDDPTCPSSGSQPQTTADTNNSGSEGDPVNTFSGELYRGFEPDLDLAGPLPLKFARYYASGLMATGISGRLGENWRHNFEWLLTDGGTFIEIINHRGRRIRFVDDAGQWRLDGPRDVLYQLVAEPGGWVLGDPTTNLVYVFGLSLNLDLIQDGNGNSLSLSYSGSDLDSVSDGLGRMLDFGYTNGRLTSVSDGIRTVTFGYDGTGTDLVSVTDARTQTTTFSYQAGSLMTGMTRPRGNTPLTQQWDASGRVVSQSNPFLDTTGFAYATPANGDTTISDPQPQVSSRVHEHASWGGLTAIVDQSGQTAQIGNDGHGRRGAIVDRLGDTTVVEYDEASGEASRHIRADGSTIRVGLQSYFVRGVEFRRESSVIYPDGSAVLRSYDSSGNLVSVTDAGLNRWQFVRNGRGQILTLTNPEGGVITQTFHPDGTLASRQDPAGNLTQFDYDNLRRLNLITYADATTRAISWDPTDRPLTITDSLGNTTSYQYDVNGLLASVTDLTGQVTTYAYDDADRAISTQNPEMAITAVTYDAQGRIDSITDPTARIITLDYDLRGRPASRSDPDGNQTAFTYDDEGVLASITDATGNAITATTNSLGEVIALTSPLGETIQIAYDANGRRSGITLPEGGSITRKYDANGRVEQVAQGSTSVALQYGALGGINAMIDSRGNASVATYDNQGRLLSRTDRLGNSVLRSYDNRNRIASLTFPGGLGNASYSYDANGNLTLAQYSDGLAVTAVYDAQNRITGGTGLSLAYDGAGRVNQSNGIALVRDGAGRISSMTYPGGLVVSYGYDSRGLLTSINDSAGNSAQYSHDATARLTSVQRSNGIQTQYTYDAVGRLLRLEHAIGNTNKGVNTPLFERDMRYDANGRLLEATGTTLVIVDLTGINTQAAGFNNGDQVIGNTYDSLRRLRAAGARLYTFDLRNNLQNFDDGNGMINFDYDILGFCVSRTEGGSTTDHHWNYATAQPVLASESVAGSPSAHHITTPGGQPVWSVFPGAGVEFLLPDEQANVVLATDASGTVTYQADYDVFNNRIGATGSLDGPFGAGGLNGIVTLADGVLFDGPAQTIDTTLGTRITPSTSDQLLPSSTNPYLVGPGGNPVTPMNATSINANAIGAAQRGDAVNLAVPDPGLTPDLQASEVPAGFSPFQFPSDMFQADSPFPDDPFAALDLEPTSRPAQEPGTKPELCRASRRTQLLAKLEVLRKREARIRKEAQQSGVTLDDSADPIPLSIPSDLGNYPFGLFGGPIPGDPVPQEPETTQQRLERELLDARDKVNNLKREIERQESVLEELAVVVSLC